MRQSCLHFFKPTLFPAFPAAIHSLCSVLVTSDCPELPLYDHKQMFQKHLGKWRAHYHLYFTGYQVGCDLKDHLLQPVSAKAWSGRGTRRLTTVDCLCAGLCTVWKAAGGQHRGCFPPACKWAAAASGPDEASGGRGAKESREPVGQLGTHNRNGRLVCNKRTHKIICKMLGKWHFPQVPDGTMQFRKLLKAPQQE